MKYCVLKDEYDMTSSKILAIPDKVNNSDVQKEIYKIREKYYFDDKFDGWTENGIHWFDYLLSVIEEKYGVKVFEIYEDIYY